MGLLKRKAKSDLPMVNCKACGRPFPMPVADDGVEMSIAQVHQCPYCGESAEYSELDAIAQD